MDRLGRLLILAALFALALTCAASAATRYAAPGGTGADPCESASAPCSLFKAADQNAPSTTVQSGDVVELAPGTYTEAAEDLGPSDYIQIASGVTVRGTPGQPKPLFEFDSETAFYGAFFVAAGAKLADVRIHNEGDSGAAVSIFADGIVERVFARSTEASFTTCQITEGVLRDSVCLNETDGIAIGASASIPSGTHAITLRNVSAIATGPGSRGGDFAFFASASPTNVNISAKSVLIKGEGTDLTARGLSLAGTPGSPGANTAISLDHSDYAEIQTFTSGTGTAFVTAPGSGDNITADPVLASDHYHQLAASPTVNKGAVDGLSGTLDIDGQLRSIGLVPDIGADELGNPTTTTIKCSPATVDPNSVGSQLICTVTVEDLGSVLTPPTGQVAFSSSSGLSVTASCVLTQASEASSFCSAIASPSAGASGPQTVTAVYGGDSEHEGSQGSASVTVEAPAGSGGGTGGGGNGGSGGSGGTGGGNGGGANPAPVTQLGKHPPKRTKKRRARFTFGSNEAGSRFECKLDGKPFKACASPYRRKVKPGKHVFKVRAIDVGGKKDPTPVVFPWRVIAP